MSEIHTPSARCLRCISVKYATLALAIGYLAMHVLGLSFMIFMALNLDQLVQSWDPNLTRADLVFTRNIVLVQEDDRVDRYVSPDFPIQDEYGDETIIRETDNTYIFNTNITTWVTTLVLNSPLSMSAPTKSQLNLAIIFCVINAAVAILAICGIMKRLPGCVVPFFVSQGADLILSFLTTIGVCLNGVGAKEDLLTSTSASGTDIGELSSAMWRDQAVLLTAQICMLITKVYLLVIVWKCIRHIKEEKECLVREEYNDRWKENIIKGQLIIYDVPLPPPAYENDTDSVVVFNLPAYSA